MSVERFPDRRAVMFGRAPDVATLLGRCSDSEAPPNGVTFVTGRPKAGKSWLLRELGRRLVEMDFLVGYAESSGATTDLALWAVADAYEQWLSSSTWREQGKSLIERHKKHLVGKVGLAVAEALELALKAQGNPLGGKVRDLFAGLAAANRDLQTGGLVLAPLPYDVTRDLADLLHRLSEKTVVLVFDAWEQSPRLTHEAGLLDAYLRNAEDWPPTHLFVAVRVEDQESEAVRKARALSRSGPYAAQVRLGEMRIEEDPGERQRFVGYLRDIVTTAGDELSDDALLDEVAGYPGVVEYWTTAARRHDLPDAAALEQLADDAHRLRYRDLEAALCRLQKGNAAVFDLALQLSLLPEVGSETGWETLRKVLHTPDDLDSCVAELQQTGILDPTILTYPTFGHSIRYETARRWATVEAAPHARRCASRLLSSLTGEIRPHAPEAYILALADFGFDEGLLRLQLPENDLLISHLARSLCIETRTGELRRLHLVLRTLDETYPKASPLLSAGLFVALHFAIQEEDLALRDRLLRELHYLAEQHPDEPFVRGQLLVGLITSLTDTTSKDESQRSRQLLDDLRRLAEEHPGDADTRLHLGLGLVLTMATQEEAAYDRRAELLRELRRLSGNHPNDPGVREMLARGLVITVHLTPDEDAPQRDQLLGELRSLAEQYPGDAKVLAQLLLGLVAAVKIGSPEWNQFQDELRIINEKYSTELEEPDLDPNLSLEILRPLLLTLR